MRISLGDIAFSAVQDFVCRIQDNEPAAAPGGRPG
jgi:hypothetical protein